ncbi:MAG TPA: AraC family transcriptional regulator [Polyangiaceae bacterium]|nr:AraC family transcriptional regulator [Polyangiaceae bacterium]
MPETTVLQRGPLTVVDYRCQSARHEPAYGEWHDSSSVSFVRRGTFGYRCRGRAHELVAGAVLVGRAGDEFVCTHDHHGGGDECLSFKLTPELAEQLGAQREAWSRSVLPPLAELMVLGEQAQAVAEGKSDLGLDEAGLSFVSRCLELAAGASPEPVVLSPVLCRRALESALWLEAHASEPIDLAQAAAYAGTSSYHFLRLFSCVVGATPHQYLVRCRLRHAARLLSDDRASVTGVALDVGFGDVSNFIRTFRRAAGVTPLQFQARARARRRRGHARQAPVQPRAAR